MGGPLRVTNPSRKKKSLPLTEALVFDIVEFLLKNNGYGYSNEISYYIVDNKPRRYTSREVVGILRNRPMFRHAQSSERKGGNKVETRFTCIRKVYCSKRLSR